MRLYVWAALSCAAMLIPWPAQAELLPITCRPSGVVEGIVQSFGAVARGAGLAGEGQGMALGEIMIAPAGQWAFMLRLSDGRTCSVASGHDWQAIAAPDPGVPSVRGSARKPFVRRLGERDLREHWRDHSGTGGWSNVP